MNAISCARKKGNIIGIAQILVLRNYARGHEEKITALFSTNPESQCREPGRLSQHSSLARGGLGVQDVGGTRIELEFDSFPRFGEDQKRILIFKVLELLFLSERTPFVILGFFILFYFFFFI